jgi:hypothetical protein
MLFMSKVTAEIKELLPSLKVVELKLNVKSLRLPPLYSSLYDLTQLQINGHAFLLVRVKDGSLGPREFKKHGVVIQNSIDLPLIWFLEKLHFHKTQRLIENGMNFIVSRKQIHLPSVNISVRQERDIVKPVVQKLNGLAIKILERQVLIGDLEGKNKLEVAEVFQESPMNVSRALAPLLDLGLCEEEKLGVSKILRFKGKIELWFFFKTKIASPILQTVFLAAKPPKLPFSGISALAQVGMLTDEEIPTFAASKKKCKNLILPHHFVLEEFAKAKLEIWDRDPIPGDMKKQRINSLDCYLVLKDENDERIKMELEQLLLMDGLKL